ncbi:MAG: sulfate transporter CysZ [Gammaproteobacteria bacterium]|jgi:CysZ protein|nr:sulfate transporter CysZ [Gammaproteobacteria bacterium]
MDIAKGFIYLTRGARLLMHKELRLFVLLPLLVNILLFALAIGLIFSYAGGWVDAVVTQLPDWLAWGAWLLWLLLTLLVGMGVFWGFNLVANLIAAPLNGLLAEKTQILLTGSPVDGGGLGDLLRMMPSALGRELSKWLYYLPRLLLLFLLSWIPGLQLLTPWLWLAFGAWMMSIQYVDYPMDNNGIGFSVMRQRLRQRKLLHLSFGSAVSLLLLVPIINFFVMPIAVVGATALWVDEHQQ